jgi:hypothetical protein
MDKEKQTYYLFLIGVFLIPGSLALIIEHWLSWGMLEFELDGHETYGLILAVIGALFTLPYLRKRKKRG